MKKGCWSQYLLFDSTRCCKLVSIQQLVVLQILLLCCNQVTGRSCKGRNLGTKFIHKESSKLNAALAGDKDVAAPAKLLVIKVSTATT